MSESKDEVLLSSHPSRDMQCDSPRQSITWGDRRAANSSEKPGSRVKDTSYFRCGSSAVWALVDTLKPNIHLHRRARQLKFRTAVKRFRKDRMLTEPRPSMAALRWYFGPHFLSTLSLASVACTTYRLGMRLMSLKGLLFC